MKNYLKIKLFCICFVVELIVEMNFVYNVGIVAIEQW